MSLSLVSTPAAHAQQVYFNDFSGSAGSEWSNNTIATSNGERFLGASANGFGNGTNTLTLTGLAAHSAVVIDFDLYIIGSWDGNGPQGGGVDNWQLTANSANVLLTSFANYTGGNTQSYTNQLPPFGPGGSFAPRTGQFEGGHLGFGTGDFGDATYRFSFVVPDTASSLTLNFTSFQNQAPGDEGWGLDNVRVTLRPAVTADAPEPGSLALLLPVAGVAGIVIRKRRRK